MLREGARNIFGSAVEVGDRRAIPPVHVNGHRESSEGMLGVAPPQVGSVSCKGHRFLESQTGQGGSIYDKALGISKGVFHPMELDQPDACLRE